MAAGIGFGVVAVVVAFLPILMFQRTLSMEWLAGLDDGFVSLGTIHDAQSSEPLPI